MIPYYFMHLPGGQKTSILVGAQTRISKILFEEKSLHFNRCFPIHLLARFRNNDYYSTPHYFLSSIMPRGKNYVNNNRGVFLQASKKNKLKQSMRQCEYGSACNRPDCIYRHDFVEEKSNEVCLQFLAGICAFFEWRLPQTPSL